VFQYGGSDKGSGLKKILGRGQGVRTCFLSAFMVVGKGPGYWFGTIAVKTEGGNVENGVA